MDQQRIILEAAEADVVASGFLIGFFILNLQ